MYKPDEEAIEEFARMVDTVPGRVRDMLAHALTAAVASFHNSAETYAKSGNEPMRAFFEAYIERTKKLIDIVEEH